MLIRFLNASDLFGSGNNNNKYQGVKEFHILAHMACY